MASFVNGLNYPIKRIVKFQPYSSLVELVHQATKAERQVLDDFKYAKTKTYFTAKPTSSTQPWCHKLPNPTQDLPQDRQVIQADHQLSLKKLPPSIQPFKRPPPSLVTSRVSNVKVKHVSHLSVQTRGS